MQLAGKLEVSKARNHLKFFSNLALLYQQMGKYTEAEEIYHGLEKRLERGKPEFANFLNNVAILAMLMNRAGQGGRNAEKSAEIYKTSFGRKIPAYAKVISDLGNFYRYKGRYAEAEPLLTTGNGDKLEQSLGNDHPLLCTIAGRPGYFLLENKRLWQSYTLYHEVMEKSLDFINRYFPPMSEAEKTKYWDLLSPRFQRFYNFAIGSIALANKDIVNDLFEYRVATKGLLLSSTRKISESILNSGNEQLINDYVDWIDQKEQLTTFYAYSKEDLKEQSSILIRWRKPPMPWRKRLSENSKEFSQFFFTSKTKFTEVQKELKADEALIEIIRLEILTRYSPTVPLPGTGGYKKQLHSPNWCCWRTERIWKTNIQNLPGIHEEQINDEQSYESFLGAIGCRSEREKENLCFAGWGL